jgi:hypothetical protein
MQRSCSTIRMVAFLMLIALPSVAEAGMPSFSLTDVGRMRFSALSFFLVGFLASAWGIQRLWNVLQRDFPRLPRLTFKTSAGIVFLWGVLFVLVLTMISGARELMTPGAWEKQGATYKLAEKGDSPAESRSHDTLTLQRQQQLLKLHTALLGYAARHEGRYPTETELSGMDGDVWNLPERLGSRYLYVAGQSVDGVSNVLAYEPRVYEDPQLVLWTDGRTQVMSAAELESALQDGSTP